MPRARKKALSSAEGADEHISQPSKTETAMTADQKHQTQSPAAEYKDGEEREGKPKRKRQRRRTRRKTTDDAPADASNNKAVSYIEVSSTSSDDDERKPAPTSQRSAATKKTATHAPECRSAAAAAVAQKASATTGGGGGRPPLSRGPSSDSFVVTSGEESCGGGGSNSHASGKRKVSRGSDPNAKPFVPKHQQQTHRVGPPPPMMYAHHQQHPMGVLVPDPNSGQPFGVSPTPPPSPGFPSLMAAPPMVDPSAAAAAMAAGPSPPQPTAASSLFLVQPVAVPVAVPVPVHYVAPPPHSSGETQPLDASCGSGRASTPPTAAPAAKPTAESSARKDPSRHIPEVVNVHKKNLVARGFKDFADWASQTRPDGTKKHLYVGRDMTRYIVGSVGSKWGNPYSSGVKRSLEEGLKLYDAHVREKLWADLDELGLYDEIGCWCKPAGCHGDTLIKLLLEKREADETQRKKEQELASQNAAAFPAPQPILQQVAELQQQAQQQMALMQQQQQQTMIQVSQQQQQMQQQFQQQQQQQHQHFQHELNVPPTKAKKKSRLQHM